MKLVGKHVDKTRAVGAVAFYPGYIIQDRLGICKASA